MRRGRATADQHAPAFSPGVLTLGKLSARARVARRGRLSGRPGGPGRPGGEYDRGLAKPRPGQDSRRSGATPGRPTATERAPTSRAPGSTRASSSAATTRAWRHTSNGTGSSPGGQWSETGLKSSGSRDAWPTPASWRGASCGRRSRRRDGQDLPATAGSPAASRWPAQPPGFLRARPSVPVPPRYG